MIEPYTLLVYILSYLGLFLLSFYVLSFVQRKSDSIPEFSENLSVSILIPAYNEEKSIIPTLQSALALNYPRNKLEIIVIDDGSTDTTLKRARAFAASHSNVRVLHQSNGGKARALNTALKYAKGDIVLSMDADSFAHPDALRRMVARFYNARIMAVTSSITIDNPHTFWQRLQHIEYQLTVFFRRALSFTNSIYITSGAFSAYRRSFFVKHGGYAEGTITEDLEIALRIQSLDYEIEYAPGAIVKTIAPAHFKELLYQRRRWYTGLVRNLWNYRNVLFGTQRGILGMLILPSVIVSVLFSLALTFYTLAKTFDSISSELLSFRAINFEFNTVYELNRYLVEHFLFTFFSNPLYLFMLFFLGASFMYLLYARKHLGAGKNLIFNYVLFVILYGIIFSFWWCVSLVYLAFNRRIAWRPRHG